MLYHYHLGPFFLESEMDLPALHAKQPDMRENRPYISVKFGHVPKALIEPLMKRAFFQVAINDVLIDIAHVARFRIQNRSMVTIQPYSGTCIDDWRPFFLGPVLSVLCQQCGFLILHACAAVINDKAIAFAGASRAGKSTLITYLHRAGFPVLTDDLCIIDASTTGAVKVYPCYPTIRLWSDTLLHYETSLLNLNKVKKTLEKYLLPIERNFHPSEVQLSGIYHLQKSVNTDSCSIKQYKGINAVNTLMKVTHRRRFAEGLGLNTENFRQCTVVAQQANIWQLIRPWGMKYQDRVVKTLKKHWKEEQII